MGLFPRKTAAEPVIDLTEAERAPAPKQRWGQPGRCPQCSGVGYLDRIDMIDRVMYQHCTECLHRWATTQAELTAVSA